MSASILVTGGAGYVGSVLVPRLLARGNRLRVLDLCLYGEEVLAPVRADPNFELLIGDIRDRELVRRAVIDCDQVIHLACISNDPSFELDRELGKSINFDAFEPLVRASIEAGVSRFIYASSSSVYGVSDSAEVTESHPLAPLTDYSRYKALCEPLLLQHASARFCPVVVRPATLCGLSPRMRLDLTVNILTSHALGRGKITVFGGAQKRPNLHIDDMVDLYLCLAELPAQQISGQIFNYGHQNHTVSQIAEIVRSAVENALPDRGPIAVETSASDDQRSYHIASRKIFEQLGVSPKKTIEHAVRELAAAFSAGKLPDLESDDRYYNVRRMKRLRLT